MFRVETLPEREGTTAADNIHLSSLEEGQNFGGLLRQWHLFRRRFKEQPGLPSLWSGGAYSSGSGHSPLLLLSGSCLIPLGVLTSLMPLPLTQILSLSSLWVWHKVAHLSETWLWAFRTYYLGPTLSVVTCCLESPGSSRQGGTWVFLKAFSCKSGNGSLRYFLKTLTIMGFMKERLRRREAVFPSVNTMWVDNWHRREMWHRRMILGVWLWEICLVSTFPYALDFL